MLKGLKEGGASVAIETKLQRHKPSAQSSQELPTAAVADSLGLSCHWRGDSGVTGTPRAWWEKRVGDPCFLEGLSHRRKVADPFVDALFATPCRGLQRG